VRYFRPAVLGTKLWRVDKRVEQVANRDESLEIERLARRFEELREAILQGVDIEIHDYTGQRYDVGLTVGVLTYQPTADITTGDEVIIETVKPTMYHHGSLISPGEVVVGVPLVEGEKAEDAM
jgi:hypothetical protein